MSNQTKLLWIDNGKGQMVDITSSIMEAHVQHVPRGTRRETFLHFALDFEATQEHFLFSKESGEFNIRFIDLVERKVYEGKWNANRITSSGQALLVTMSRGPGSRDRSVEDSDVHCFQP